MAVAKGTSAPKPLPAEMNGNGKHPAAAELNGAGGSTGKRRRASAEDMAKSQRDISVSEFFAKNRHLLGFDNPRKALLTTVKEAVDNSLDACEEAGIVPEIWVHIQPAGKDRFKVGVQDNGPGIVEKKIPLIFGKLLYGSKFHRLRMSRGQQGIGISAAGMYGMLTTGKPVKIISQISPRKPAHYYELQINTKTNHPDILHNIEIKPGEAGANQLKKHGIEWVPQYEPHEEGAKPRDVKSGTRVTIELEAKYTRGRGSVDEYLYQTAIANPHVTIHYLDPEDDHTTYYRSTDQLPPEPKEIKPHPYGVELGRLMTMMKASEETTLSAFLTNSFSRVSPGIAKKICDTAQVSTRSSLTKIGRDQADALFHAIQATKISNPSTDCISPIGEQLILRGLYQIVPGEFYASATRPPNVYRGNPFLIEVGIAYGGEAPVQRVTLEMLTQLLSESDARTLRQFLMHTFNGLGNDGAEKIMKEAGFGPRSSPSKLAPEEIKKLLDAMRSVNVSEGQSMQIMRYANRVPLQFKPMDCAITQAIMGTNWRSYGLSQSRNSLPSGPVSVMVHMASVWVPYTSESKEAVASYPEIEKELRLALQSVGRKLGMYLRRRLKVKQQGERRNIFLRYLGEVAGAVSDINTADKSELYEQLVALAKKHTSDADMKLDKHGRPIIQDEEEAELQGDNVLIVDPSHIDEQLMQIVRRAAEKPSNAAEHA